MLHATASKFLKLHIVTYSEKSKQQT